MNHEVGGNAISLQAPTQAKKADAESYTVTSVKVHRQLISGAVCRAMY